MPTKYFIDKEAKLLITTWEGDAVDIEFIEAITKYQKDVQLNPEYKEYNEVANFCKIASIKLTQNGLKRIGTIASKTDQHKFNSRLALVVSSGTAFNLARIYASFRNIQNGTNKEIRIFKNEIEAIEWAQNKV